MHRELFLWNHGVAPALERSRAEHAEAAWISGVLEDLEPEGSAPTSVAELRHAIVALVERDAEASGDGARFIAEDSTRRQFAVLIGQYAVDGLTEALAMYAAVPRLDAVTQLPVIRILIDEFGCGNPDRVHSQLYRNLLRELGMSTGLDAYVDRARNEVLAFVNVYYWLTHRAPAIDYYLGALAFTEASIPHSFQAYAQACERLGIRASDYFTEHIHIDDYHTREALGALSARAAHGALNPRLAWTGALLARKISIDAADAAVEVASAEAAQ